MSFRKEGNNSIMQITEIQKFAQGLLLLTTAGQIKLEVLGERVIHIVYTQREKFSETPSLMVLPQKTTEPSWSSEESDTEIILKTAKLQMLIDKTTGAFTWLDADGKMLLRESQQGGKWLSEVPVEKAVFDDDAAVSAKQTVDGLRITATSSKTVVDRMAYSTKLVLEFSDGEAIYGLGQHEDGILNYRGQHEDLYQQNMKVVAPMIVSTKGYGILWDSYSWSAFHDDVYGSYFWTDIDDEMDFYFIYGPEFDRIVAECRILTGQAPLLPKWAYGYVQSKECYTSQEELLDIVKTYREKGLPLDCIVQDWKSWPEGQWGQKSFDDSRFPEPAKMMDDLHAQHARLMISIWPNMNNNTQNYAEMKEQGLLLANDSNYDPFRPEGRTLYWRQAHDGLFQYGLDAWWCDCTEPFEADWKGTFKPEPSKRTVINTSEAKKYLDPEYINVYSLLHSQALYEGQRSVTSEKRVVNLTRSHFPGQQRYSTILWSGDVTATWQTLRDQIPAGLNVCATGSPKWTFDIGGFFVGRKPDLWFWDGDFPEGCDDEGYRELYVRWFQLGAFLPMFRSHGTDTPREIWRFGQPGDVTYDTLMKFDFLRYRLLPYIYSLAGWETHKAYTMLRMLAFDFRHDPAVYDIKDQFMFGPALMVCPVTEPMYYAPGSTPLEGTAKSRSVYLPAGCDWYDFWTGKRYTGGQTIEADAPLDILPLFVKAGSILPMGPKVQYADESPDAAYELRVYPGADGCFELYEDEGDNYNYEQGAYAWTPISWDDHTEALTFSNRQGRFDGLVEEREYHVTIVREKYGTGLEQEAEADAVLQYQGKVERLSGISSCAGH